MNDKIKNVLWGIATQYLYQVSIMVLQVLVAPLLLKYSGAAALGGYASLMQYIGYLTLLDLGFTGTLSRYLSQAFNDTSNEKRNFINIFNIGRWYLFSACSIMGIVIASTSFVLPNSIGLTGALKQDAFYAMLILALWYGIRFYFIMFNITLFATQQMRTANICLTIGVSIRFALTLIFLHLHYGITGIVLANVTGDFLAALLQMLFFKKKYPNIRFSWRIYDKTVFKKLFSFGLDAFLINISTRIVQSSTTFVSGILLGAVVASHYYSMSTPMFLIFTFVNMIMYNMLPLMNEMVANERWNELAQTYISTFQLKMTLLIPAVLGLLLYHQYIIILWVGKSQYEGFFYTVIFCIYLIVITIGSFNENMLIVLGNIKWFARLQIVSTLMGLLLTLIGGYLFGLQGVVLGNLISITPVTIYVFFRLLKLLHIKFRFTTFFPPFSFYIFLGIVFIILLFIQKIIVPANLIQVFIAAILFLMIIVFKGVDKQKRLQAARQLLKFVKR